MQIDAGAVFQEGNPFAAARRGALLYLGFAPGQLLLLVPT